MLSIGTLLICSKTVKMRYSYNLLRNMIQRLTNRQGYGDVRLGMSKIFGYCQISTTSRT